MSLAQHKLYSTWHPEHGCPAVPWAAREKPFFWRQFNNGFCVCCGSKSFPQAARAAQCSWWKTQHLPKFGVAAGCTVCAELSAARTLLVPLLSSAMATMASQGRSPGDGTLSTGVFAPRAPARCFSHLPPLESHSLCLDGPPRAGNVWPHCPGALTPWADTGVDWGCCSYLGLTMAGHVLPCSAAEPITTLGWTRARLWGSHPLHPVDASGWGWAVQCGRGHGNWGNGGTWKDAGTQTAWRTWAEKGHGGHRGNRGQSGGAHRRDGTRGHG